MKKQWTIGWKPIDKATAAPKWSGVPFDSFGEASRCADSLNMADPESHYFVSLIEPKDEYTCMECGYHGEFPSGLHEIKCDSCGKTLYLVRAK